MERNGGKVKTNKSKIQEEKKTMPIFVKYGIVALIVLAAIIAGMFIWFNIAGGYVARVGDEKIGVKEYKLYLALQMESMYEQARSLDPSLNEDTFWDTEYEGETALENIKKRTLEGLRDIKVQVAEAKKNGIKLEKDEIKNIDDYIKQIVENEQIGSGSRIRANKYFEENYGASIDVFRETQLESALAQKFMEKVITERNIPEDELQKEYDKETKIYDKVSVTHILYLYEGNEGKRSKEESKKLADEALAKVKAGEDAKELAKKLSEDPGVTDNSGVYSFTKYDNYMPEFIDWAIKANVGDSGIVETDYGYHVMKLDKRDTKQFSDVKDKIKTEISASKYQTELDEWKKDAKYALEPNNAVYNEIK